ncbi:hypothetical protein C2E23DRAFT_834762 [Lenzites betulinus]|nr:hypothetical protein C2E23DRAFT_834762 [Lenzites betulinus]
MSTFISLELFYEGALVLEAENGLASKMFNGRQWRETIHPIKRAKRSPPVVIP